MPESPLDSALADALRAFAAAPQSPVEAALLVARVVDPGTDIAWCRREFARLAAAVPQPATPEAVVASLRDAGFKGATDYYKYENSALQHVLRNREGIPISLAMVVLAVCDILELSAAGINFPGHFLVTIAGQLVDPFAMRVVETGEVQTWLRERQLDPAQALAEATPLAILLRMLNNLSALARSRGDYARALEMTDCKLLVATEPLPVYLERMELWSLLGAPAMARHDAEAALALTPEGALAEQLRQRLSELEEQPQQLH